MGDHSLIDYDCLRVDNENDKRGDPNDFQYHDASLSLLNSSKVDPSYKSKRYRDKLRGEIKALEDLLPVDKSTLHRKLDSQTVFRLVIAYFRTKMFLDAADIKQSRHATKVQNIKRTCETDTETLGINDDVLRSKDVLQALDGFLMVVTADGTILYVSKNIIRSLGFNQVDLMHRCVYGIVHPDDHHELKMVLETSLLDAGISLGNQKHCSTKKLSKGESCKSVSFLVRIKCFNGTTTGYLKMQCTGHMRSFPGVVKSPRSSNQVVFALCRPFQSISTDPEQEAKSSGFWSKHGLDLKFKHFDTKASDVTGYTMKELEGISFYSLVHPEDLYVFRTCHQILIHTEEIQTMYFRIELKNGKWLWLHTRGKVVFKNSKKYSIIFTHCPVREEDSTYIQQEAIIRRRYALIDLMNRDGPLESRSDMPNIMKYSEKQQFKGSTTVGFISQDFSVSSQNTNTSCPSTWHSKSECHSPVFPATSLPHKFNMKDRYISSGAKKKATKDTTLAAPGDEMVYRYVPSVFNSPPQMNLPLGGSVKNTYENLHGFLPLSSHQGYERVPQRRYLMHVNGVGVSRGEPTPKTLFFRGSLTAYEALPSSPYAHPSSGYHQAEPQGMASYGFLESRGDERTSDLSSTTQDSMGLETSPNHRLISGVHFDKFGDNLGANNHHHLQQTISRPASRDECDEKSTSQANIPFTHEPINYLQDGSYFEPVVSAQGVGDVARGEACGTELNGPLEGKVETRPHLPSCVYEGKALLSSEARCFQPTSSSVGMIRVKQDPGGRRERKYGVADLPNIGSFLECLKDISG